VVYQSFEDRPVKAYRGRVGFLKGSCFLLSWYPDPEAFQTVDVRGKAAAEILVEQVR
jgi:hypothetical protein